MVKNVTLLIEDDPDHADLIISALNDKETDNGDKDVILIRDGQDAIDYFHKNDFPENTCQAEFISDDQEHFQVERILLDINLPKVNGMDILKCIRQKPGYYATPVTILSTNANKDTIEEAYMQGADSFVEKLVSYEELVEKLKYMKNYLTKPYSLQ